MQKAIQVLLSGVLLCGGGLFHATSVDARSVPGIAGQTLNPCFHFHASGWISNFCENPNLVRYPLPIQNYGDKVIDVWAFAENLDSLKCQATMIDNDGSVANTSFVQMPTTLRWDNIPLWIYVQSTGALTVNCMVDGGARVTIATIYSDD